MPEMPPMTNSGEGYGFTEEQWMLKMNVRALVEKEIAPRFKEEFEEESANKFYHEGLKKLGEAGFLRVGVPEMLGGYGMGTKAIGIVGEEVARGCGALAIHAIENPLFATFGTMITPEAYAPYWEGLMNGDYVLAGGMCSPEGQANYGEQADIADFDEATQEWVLDGEKAFCSGGTFADVITVAGNYKGDQYMWFVPDHKNIEGFVIHSHPEIGASPCSSSITLNNVRLPKNRGALSGGVIKNKQTPETPIEASFPTCVAAMSIGTAEAALDETIEYLKKRTSYFKPVASYGSIQGKIVDMKARLEAARSLVYTTLTMIDNNYEDAVVYGHLAKSYACDVCRQITAECVQMWGNLGANPETGISRHMMDAVVFGIGTGTSDMHINGAAIAMGLPDSGNPVSF